ncbi:hypothetical protein ACFLVR_01745 [Chloroflexota bacterium]
MKKQRYFIRNMEAGKYLEIFLVAAVASILAIRAYLAITGYPQLGNSDLHIAHMLWGGVFMVVGIIALSMFLGKAAQYVGVICGGIGFGTFVDEVGKFITQDNDYFYQPSVSIMYVTFIVIFLIVRNIQTRVRYSRIEYLMNAIHELEEVAHSDLDAEEKEKVSEYLAKCDQNDSLVAELISALAKIDLVPVPEAGFYVRIRARLAAFYKNIATTSWFKWVIIAFFSAQVAFNLFYVFVLVALKMLNWDVLDIGIIRSIAGELEKITFSDYAYLISSLFAAGLALWGLMLFIQSRLSAFKMFERSVMVSLFLTQVFVFFQAQFWGLAGLIIYLLVYVALRFMIDRETHAVLEQNQNIAGENANDTGS